MKRLFMSGIAVALVCGSLIILPSSAQAASIATNCADVKKQVLAYEGQEKGFSVQYAPVNGKWSWFFSSAHLNEYWLLQKKIIAFEVNLFTYDLNHIACFTPKQQAYAKVVYKQWAGVQKFLKDQPDWINGFAFTPIVWDSIYAKDLVMPGV